MANSSSNLLELNTKILFIRFVIFSTFWLFFFSLLIIINKETKK